MLRRMEGLAPARLIHVLARGRASAAWSHLYARHSPKLESWNASTRRNGPNTLLGSTAQHSNRQRDRRDQDSPDPERERRYAAATYKTNTNREIVSSVCCESPRSMSELVLVCSTQVTSQPSAMEVADDTRRVSRQVGRSARRVGEASCV